MLLCLIAATTSTMALVEVRGDLDVIAEKTVPVVDAFQSMLQSTFELSSHAADYLATAPLAGREPCTITARGVSGSLTVQECSDRNIDAQVSYFNQQLVKAASKATFPGEPIAVERVVSGFETLTARLALMRDAYAQATSRSDPRDEAVADPRGAPMRKAYAAFEAASAAFHTETWAAQSTAGLAIPSCDIDTAILDGKVWPFDTMEHTLRCLSKTNKQHLDDTYKQTMRELQQNLRVAIVCAVLLCGFLLFTTWRMAAVTHRIVNPGLTIALLFGLAGSSLVIYRFAQFQGERGLFQIMVQDAYGSYYRSVHLKQYALAANADESRWLVAKTFGDEQAAAAWTQDWEFRTFRVRDDIQKLTAQRTWPDEDAPLRALQQHWNTYIGIDRKLRDVGANTNDPAAIVEAERMSTGASNRAFADMLDAAERLGSVNYTVYETTRQRITAMIDRTATVSLWLFGLAALATVWGIHGRWKDF